VVWIGYIQWQHDNGFNFGSHPILKPLENIKRMDAVLAYNEQGRAVEPEWPDADVIIGNPPFVGGNRIRQELGDSYVESLFELYKGRLSAFCDYVCYWFEKSRAMIEDGRAKRVGLLGTQAIRGGVSRVVLDRIKQCGAIFMAWRDRDWLLDGATVHVSFVGFDDGSETRRLLDGIPVNVIYPDLTSVVDLTSAARLRENARLWAYGSQQKGSFDVPPDVALRLRQSISPFGKNNSDVVRSSINGKQLLQRTEETWVIDFGVKMPLKEAALYEAPFEYVRAVVLPERKNRSEKIQREYWWLHARPSPKYRKFLSTLPRYIATPGVSKHRVFVWLDRGTLVDHAIVVFGRSDDYFLGVLQSRIHELWSRRKATQVREAESGLRYTPRSTFETFPFPWPPGREPNDDPRVTAVAAAAVYLVKRRDEWLNPPGVSGDELKESHADESVQRKSHVAAGRSPGTGRCCIRRLRLAEESERSGHSDPTPSAQHGAIAPTDLEHRL
jgi:type II restriction/modification system DNA methylase subunit YeeA